MSTDSNDGDGVVGVPHAADTVDGVMSGVGFDGVEATRRRLEQLAGSLLAETLSSRRYDPAECRRQGELLARQLLERLQQQENAARLTAGRQSTAAGAADDDATVRTDSRKYVVLVSIGSVTEKPDAVQFGSRCLWDDETDLIATARYSNSSLFGLATIFAVQFQHSSSTD